MFAIIYAICTGRGREDLPPAVSPGGPGEVSQLGSALLEAQELAAIKQSGVVKKDEGPLDEKADEGSSAFVRNMNIYASSAVDQPAAKAETLSQTASGGGRGRRLASGSPPVAGLAGGSRKTGGAAAAGRVIDVSNDSEGIDVEFILWGYSQKSKLAGVPPI